MCKKTVAKLVNLKNRILLTTSGGLPFDIFSIETFLLTISVGCELILGKIFYQNVRMPSVFAYLKLLCITEQISKIQQLKELVLSN